MAKRSRLGKGLGALFPELPGDESAQEVVKGEPNTKKKPASKDAEGTNDSTSTNITNSETASNSTSSDATAKSSDKKSSPKTSNSGSIGVSRETKGTKTRSNRMSVPKLSDLEHPSDLFFGGADDNVSHETLTQPSHGSQSSIAKGESPQGQSASTVGEAVVTPSSKDKQAHNSELQPVQGGYMAELSVEDICANSEQPRRIFDEDELVELSHSISEVGLLQPIVVRKLKKSSQANDKQAVHYELIMGERRWRATKMAGLTEIPAIVKTTADNDMLRDALLENLHRVALNPLEEAAAYQQMMEEFGMTQEDLSKSVSKSRPQIANTLRLLKLPTAVQKKVESGVLSAGHARALLSLSSPEEMEHLADQIIAEGLSVRSTEEKVALKTNLQNKKPRKQKPSIWAGSPVLGNLENHFETKVDIKGNKKKGRIEITYSSPEDMDRILSLMLNQGGAQGSFDSKSDGWV